MKYLNTVLLLLLGCFIKLQAKRNFKDNKDVQALLEWSRAVIRRLGPKELADTPNIHTPLGYIPPKIVPTDEESRKFINFAAAAYCGSSVLNTWKCPTCLQNYEFINVTLSTINTKTFIAKSDKFEEIIVSSRGTYNLPNLGEDLILMLDYPGVGPDDVLIHGGGKLAVKELLPFVYENLEQLTKDYPNYKVIITGHSLGGALASLIYYYIKANSYFSNTVFELYTYGEPRVGNKAWADYINMSPIKIGRIVQGADIAPHLPPSGINVSSTNILISDTYYHHVTEIWISNKDFATKVCSTINYEDANCSSSLGPIYTMIDHLMYYDVDLSQCFEIDPLNFFLQILLPLDIPLSDWINLNKILSNKTLLNRILSINTDLIINPNPILYKLI